MPVTCRISDRRYITVLLSVTVVFLFADQNLLAPNLSMIATEFGFNEEEKDNKLGANIAVGFFIIGAPVALLTGYYADIVNRCKLFAAIVILGACTSGSTFFVQTYTELLISRVLTGISIGGATPIIFSLLADYYPLSKRVRVATLISVAMGAGISGGQLLAGIVGPVYGWRLPFLLIALPTFSLAILVLCTGIEPSRGAQEEEVVQHNKQLLAQAALSVTAAGATDPSLLKGNRYAEVPFQNTMSPTASGSAQQDIKVTSNVSNLYSEHMDCSKVAALFSTKTVVLIYLQGFPGCIPWGMIYVYLNDYLSANRGLSVQSATMALTIFGIGGFFGQCFGGYAGQALYNRNKRYASYLTSAATILGIFPLLYVVNGAAGGALFYISALFAGFLVNITGPIVRSMLQNVTAPEARGTAFAFFTLTDDIGKGGGPVIVAALASTLGSRQFAFNICICFWLFCGAILGATSFTVEQDESKVQLLIRQSLTNQLSASNNSNNEIIRDTFTTQDTEQGDVIASSSRGGWREFRRQMIFTSQHTNDQTAILDTSVSSFLSQRSYTESKEVHKWKDADYLDCSVMNFVNQKRKNVVSGGFSSKVAKNSQGRVAGDKNPTDLQDVDIDEPVDTNTCIS